MRLPYLYTDKKLISLVTINHFTVPRGKIHGNGLIQTDRS